ncbi:MAG: MFS transporter [Candidatus Thorarchaeota archaeon]
MAVEATPEYKERPRKNKALYGIYYATEGFAAGGIIMFLSDYLINVLGYPSYYAGILLAIGLSPSYFKIVYGLLSDSRSIGNMGNRRPYVLISIPLIIIGWLLFPFALDPISFTLIIGLTTFGAYLGDVVVDAWAVEVTSQENRGSMMGIGWGSQGIATVLGVLITTLLSSSFGYSGAFLLLGCISGAGGIVWFVFAEEKPTVETKSLSRTLNTLRTELRSSYTWLAIVAFLGGGFIFGVGTNFMLPFFKAVMLFDDMTGGLYMLLWSTFFFVGGIIGGIVYDRFSDYRTGVYVLAPSYVITLFLFGLNQAGSIEIAIITTILYGLASGLTTAAIMGFAMNITPKAIAGTFFALITSVVNIGQSGIAGPVTGYLIDNFNYSLAFTIGAIVALPIILIVKFIVPPWKRSDYVETEAIGP